MAQQDSPQNSQQRVQPLAATASHKVQSHKAQPHEVGAGQFSDFLQDELIATEDNQVWQDLAYCYRDSE